MIAYPLAPESAADRSPQLSTRDLQAAQAAFVADRLPGAVSTAGPRHPPATAPTGESAQADIVADRPLAAVSTAQARAADAPDNHLIALVGPTAVGKTALAVALAERLRAMGWTVEAVAADSRQIYRLMDIATAKPTPAERAQLPHHLIDVVWPDESYTLAQYQRDAQVAIADIHARPGDRGLPLLVGGTGLYVRAVVDGLAIPEVAPNPELRAALEAEAATHGAAVLHARLAALDPIAAARIDPANVRRVIRALEVCVITGQPFSAQQGARPTPYRTLTLGLNMDRAALYARADARIDVMLAAGLVAETRALVERGYGWELPAMSSLGYREIGAYLRGELTLPAATERFKLATHAYIRRQLTWFRPDARIHWLDAALPTPALADAALAHIRAAFPGVGAPTG